MNGIDAAWQERARAHLGDAVVAPAMGLKSSTRLCGREATGAVLLQRDVGTLHIPRSHGLDEIVRAYFANRWHVADIVWP
jgi:hypothetical protein